MKLDKILSGVDILSKYNYENINIKTLTHISNDCVEDTLFFVIDGYNTSGKYYIEDAIDKGARVIVANEYMPQIKCIQIVVDNVRIAMSQIAKIFYNSCCDKLKIISVIGTAGKTTTSMMISKILSYCGNKVGVIGTNGVYIDNIKLPTLFTTPDPIDMHYIFYQMYQMGVEYVVMEVSAQAIYLNKMHGVYSKIGVFTNISNEHLDFFKTMDNYAETKVGYFTRNNMHECVVNIDDKYAMKICDNMHGRVITYGIDEPSDVFACDIRLNQNGSDFVVNYLDEIMSIHSSFVGQYNVYNLLASITVCRRLGIESNNIVSAIAKMSKIDGRFEVFAYKDSYIIVDFAHTPDSMDKVLSTIRKHFGGEIVAVFGCVGYSDSFKRMLMGQVVSKYADTIIISTDNPCDALFTDICNDVVRGIDNGRQVYMMEDRESAIRFGTTLLKTGDVLVLLGKGSEDFQKIKGERIRYSDIEVVEKILME